MAAQQMLISMRLKFGTDMGLSILCHDVQFSGPIVIQYKVNKDYHIEKLTYII